MSAVAYIRPFQSALKYRDQPNVYRALVKAIKRDQDQGRSGFSPLREARADHGAPPKTAA